MFRDVQRDRVTSAGQNADVGGQVLRRASSIPGNAFASRVLQVLSAFKSAQPDLGVTEIHHVTGLDKSVIHRILTTLTRHGYLLRDPGTRRYRVGLELWELGGRCQFVNELSNVVSPLLTSLVDKYSVSGYIGCLDGLDMVYVASIPSKSPVRIHYDVGRRAPAHTSAFGKAVLAQLAGDEIDSLIGGPGNLGGREYLASQEFRDELASIRTTGFAVNVNRNSPEIASIGVPLATAQGPIRAAVSVSYLLAQEQGNFSLTLAGELKTLASQVQALLDFPMAAG